MEKRTGWQEQNESQIVGEQKRNGRLIGADETSKNRGEWHRLQQKNLSIPGLPKAKEWSQRHRKSSWQKHRSCPCQKEKEQSCLSRVQDHDGAETQGGQELHLGETGGIRTRAWRGKGGFHRERREIPKRKGRASKKSLPKRSRRKHERVSGRKSSPGRSAESWFHS